MSISTPIYRDLLAYQRLTIDQASTRQVAQELDISQTRVRQVVRRVTDWIAENAPPNCENDDAKQLRLAQQIAADRLEHCLQEANTAWQKTHEVKYLGLVARLILAQSQIPALPGTIEALLTDAILGPLEDTHPGQLEDIELNQNTLQENTGHQPIELSESPSPPLTPSHAANSTFQIPNSALPSPPPLRDCSPKSIPAPPAHSQTSPPTTANLTEQESSDHDDSEQRAARNAFFAPAHPPANASELSPITELKITPQKLTIHSGQPLNRHQRRRLQRLTTKS